MTLANVSLASFSQRKIVILLLLAGLARILFGITDLPRAISNDIFESIVNILVYFAFVSVFAKALYQLLFKMSDNAFDKKIRLEFKEWQVYIFLSVIYTWVFWVFLSAYNGGFNWIQNEIRDALVILSVCLYFLYQKLGRLATLVTKAKKTLSTRIFKTSVTVWDLIFFLLLVIASTIGFFGLWRGINNYVFLSSDPANIAAFVAARSHPDLFVKDALLGDPGNFRFYYTVHLPIIQFLGESLGNYGLAFISLYPVHMILQGVGFYLLGIEIFRSRFWATQLSALSLLVVTINVGEFWGFREDVLPRVSFQAMLPIVLWLSLFWRSTPKFWVAVMAMAGLLVYVHPVSAPAWGAAIWLGLFAFYPKQWPVPKRVLAAFGLALAFLLTILPFAFLYLGNYAHGETANYAQAIDIMEKRFAVGFLDPVAAIREFVLILTTREWVLFLASILGGILFFQQIKRSTDKFLTPVYFLWLLGLLLVSMMIPILDHTVALWTRRLPLQIDLIRNLRYVIPVLMIFGLWFFFGLQNSLSLGLRKIPKNAGRLALALSLIFCAWFAVIHPIVPIQDAWDCLSEGQLFCKLTDKEKATRDILDVIRELTPEGASILPTSLGSEIRYFSLRSVAFNGKDGGAFAYSNPARLAVWYEDQLQFDDALRAPDLRIRLNLLVELAKKLNADFLLLGTTIDLPEDTSQIDLIYSNDYYQLFAIE